MPANQLACVDDGMLALLSAADEQIGIGDHSCGPGPIQRVLDGVDDQPVPHRDDEREKQDKNSARAVRPSREVATPPRRRRGTKKAFHAKIGISQSKNGLLRP
jgi:hypothetical protein